MFKLKLYGDTIDKKEQIFLDGKIICAKNFVRQLYSVNRYNFSKILLYRKTETCIDLSSNWNFLVINTDTIDKKWKYLDGSWRTMIIPKILLRQSVNKYNSSKIFYRARLKPDSESISKIYSTHCLFIIL